jgi:hypothetical protein
MTTEKDLSVPKGMRVKKPHREPDMISKRGVPYFFGPDWVRETNGTIGRIIALKDKNNPERVDLHMLSKDGNISYIQGSIQQEFKQWLEDRQLDAILLGFDEDDIILTAWNYENV